MATIKIDGSKVSHRWLILYGEKENPLQVAANANIQWRHCYQPIGASYPSDSFFNGGLEFTGTQPNNMFELPDGNYSLSTGLDGGLFPFSIANGKIVHNTTTNNGYLTLSDNTITLTGYSVTIDARYLIGIGLCFLWFGGTDVHGKQPDPIVYRTLKLLPSKDYQFTPASAEPADFYFEVTPTGTIRPTDPTNYALNTTKYNSFVSFEANNTIVIKGFTIIVDARLNGSNPLSQFGVLVSSTNQPWSDNHNCFSSSKVVIGNFMPLVQRADYNNYYRMLTPTWGVSNEGFNIRWNGTSWHLWVSNSSVLSIVSDVNSGIGNIKILNDLVNIK